MSFLIKQQMAQNEAEKLKVQQEIVKAKARSRVFETSAIEWRGFKIEKYSIEALLIIGNSQHGILTMNMKYSSIKARNTIGIENEEIGRTVTARQADITRTFCNLLKQQSGPDVDLGVFNRNPLKYHNFITLFHELVNKRIDDPKGRLTRLIRYTKGDPKDMIQHCVQQPPSVGYKNAKKILDQKYGHPYNIMGVYRKEIKSRSQIRNGDGESYQSFTIFF